MSDRINETRYWPEDEGPTGATMWELREVDACPEPEDGWAWNASFVLRRFRSESVNLKGLFLRVLADYRGRPLPRGVFRVDGDWNILEIRRRKDGCQIGGCQCDGCSLWFCDNELERIDDRTLCEDCADEYRKEQEDDGEATEP